MAQTQNSGLEATPDACVPKAARCEVGGVRPGAIFREINDPTTDTRWLVAHDPAHPGGPGRLVKAEPDAKRGSGQPAKSTRVSRTPVIRAGETLVAEEHTSQVDATLEAVALGSAITGSSLEVRLKIGGRVLRAVAVAPGRVVLNSGEKVHR